MIWGSSDTDPYKGDVIRKEMGRGTSFDELTEADIDAIEEEIDTDEGIQAIDGDTGIDLGGNSLLGEVLSFYNSYELLSLANRIVWLDGVKESLGYIPEWFELDYDEIRYLVVLKQEINKKSAHESWKLSQKSAGLLAK